MPKPHTTPAFDDPYQTYWDQLKELPVLVPGIVDTEKENRTAKRKQPKRKSDWRPKRKQQSTEHVVEVSLTEEQNSTIALWHRIKVSIWDTLKESNDERLGEYYTYDEMKKLYPVLKQDHAWWSGMPAEIGRETARNVVTAFINYHKAGGGRRFQLLKQRSIDSYPFIQGVKFAKPTEVEGLGWQGNKLAMQFPGLAEVVLKPKDRHQHHFLETKMFDIGYARIWQSPKPPNKWYVKFSFRHTTSSKKYDDVKVWEAYDALWQPDADRLSTETILAELAKQGIEIHARDLAKVLKEANGEVSKKVKIGGVSLQGYHRPNGGSAAENLEQLLLRDEALDIDQLEPKDEVRIPRKRLPPPSNTPTQLTVRQRERLELEYGSAIGLRKNYIEKLLLRNSTEVPDGA